MPSVAIALNMTAIVAIILFPSLATRGMSVAILRLSECSRWFAVSGLTSAILAVWCVIYRDAVRLEYSIYLYRWWHGL